MAQIHDICCRAEHFFATTRLLLERENLFDDALVARKGISVVATRCLARGTLDSLRVHDEVSVYTIDGGWKTLLCSSARWRWMTCCTVLVGNFTKSDAFAR